MWRLGSSGGHKILLAHSGGFTLQDMSQKTGTLNLLSLRNELAADKTVFQSSQSPPGFRN